MSRRRRTGRRATVVAAALALAALLGAGCGVSTNDEPQPIARENVPSDLLETEAPAGDEVALDADEMETVSIWYLVDDGESIQLAEVSRGVPWPAQAELWMDALLDSDGPTDAERRRGISTAIPSDTRLTAVPTQEGSVLELSLSDDFWELRGTNSIRAAAQIVFTATEMPNVDAVRFVNDEGRALDVLDDEGESREEPVGREDYANLDPDAEPGS